MLQEKSGLKPLGISVFIIREDTQEYLLIRRCSSHLYGNWQMVSGTCDAGEKALDTVIREMHEETGLTANKIYSADFVEIFYESRRDMILFIPVFVAFVTGTNDIKLSPSEHDAFQWVPYAQAREILEFDNQRLCLDKIERYYVQNPPSDRFLLKKA